MNKQRKIKKFSVSEDSLVYAISFVDCPAIESNFVYFSADKPRQIFLEQEDKHLVYGAALIPDFPIYRYDGKSEYYIEFSKESIEHLAHNYLKDGCNYNFTIQHEKEVDDVTIVESWVKLSENDKSIDLGLDVPIGSWMVGCKVNNDEVWKEIKCGNAKGFSVESLLNLDEVDFEKQDTNMFENEENITVNENFWTKLVTIIKEALKAPETPNLEAEVTASEVINDIREEIAEEEVAETPIEAVPEAVEETPVEEPTEVVEEPLEPITEPTEETPEETVETPTVEEDKVKELNEIINDLNSQIESLNEQLEELKIENTKLSKQPSTKPIKTTMSTDTRTPYERMLSVMQANRKIK